jgi:hypothetical protein
MQQQGKSTLDWEQCPAPLMFNYNTSINKSTKIMPFHATFNYNPRVPLWNGVEHRFDKHLKNATGKDTSIPKNLARLRALNHNTRQIVHHNLQHTADLKEEENRKAHPEAKWPSYKIISKYGTTSTQKGKQTGSSDHHGKKQSLYESRARQHTESGGKSETRKSRPSTCRN